MNAKEVEMSDGKEVIEKEIQIKRIKREDNRLAIMASDSVWYSVFRKDCPEEKWGEMMAAVEGDRADIKYYTNAKGFNNLTGFTKVIRAGDDVVVASDARRAVAAPSPASPQGDRDRNESIQRQTCIKSAAWVVAAMVSRGDKFEEVAEVDVIISMAHLLYADLGKQEQW